MNLIGILGEAGSGKDTAGKMLVRDHGFYGIAFADPIKVFCMWMFSWSPDQLWGPSELRNALDRQLPFTRCPNCGHFDAEFEATVETAQNWDDLRCPRCEASTDPAKWYGQLSPRFALQHLGTEWARTLNDSCHVDFALVRAQNARHAVRLDPLYGTLPDKVLQDRYVNASVQPQGVYISDCRFKNEVDAIQAAGGRVYRIRRNTKNDNTTTGIAQHASEAEQRSIPDEALDGIIENHGTLDTLSERVRSLIQP